MAKPLTERDAEALNLFQHRNRLLTAIREQSLCDPEEQSYAIIFQHCCNILASAFHCNFVWAGDIDRETNCLIPFAASPPATFTDSSIQNHLINILVDQFHCDHASFTKPIYTHFATEKSGEKQICKLTIVPSGQLVTNIDLWFCGHALRGTNQYLWA